MYTIAILDGDDTRINKVREILALSDYSVVTANDGVMGQALIESTRPDLVIANIHLQRRSGIELLKGVRNDPSISCTLFFMIVESRDSKETQDSYSHGANEVVCLPEDLSLLPSMVKGRLQWHKSKHKAMSGEGLQKIPDRSSKFIKKVNAVLEEEMSNVDLHMRLLSQKLKISTSTLQKKLKKLSDKSVSQYIREYRLEKSRHLIEGGNTNLAEVADLTGFRNQSYFSKSFKAFYGYPPSKLL